MDRGGSFLASTGVVLGCSLAFFYFSDSSPNINDVDVRHIKSHLVERAEAEFNRYYSIPEVDRVDITPPDKKTYFISWRPRWG